MKEKIKELQKDGFTLLTINDKNFLIPEYRSYKDDLSIHRYYVIDYDKEVLYKSDYNFDKEYEEKINNTGLKVVILRNLIEDKFKEKATDVLEKYIELNINNIEYMNPRITTYFSRYNNEVNINYNYDFIKNFYHSDPMDMESLIETKYINFTFENMLTENIKLNGFDFDISSEEIITDDIDFLNQVFTNNEKELLLSTEQYKRGITPAIYNKLHELKDFLSGKKTINVLLNDGRSFKADANMRIFEIGNGYISEYNLKGADRDIKFDEIKCLTYNSQTLSFEPEKLDLEQLTKPEPEMNYYKLSYDDNSIYVETVLQNTYDVISEQESKDTGDENRYYSIDRITKEEYDLYSSEKDMDL